MAAVYDPFRRNQRVVIRTNDPPGQSKDDAKQNDYRSPIPKLDKLPASIQGATNKLPVDNPAQAMDKTNKRDLHFTTQDHLKRNKMATYWRTRGAHDFIIQQHKSVENQKIKKEREELLIKTKRKNALKQRIVEKKIEEAEMRGEVYIPESSEGSKTSLTERETKSQPGYNRSNKNKMLNDTSPELKQKKEKKKAKKPPVLGPNGQPLPDNIAFLGEQIDDNRSSRYYKERKVKAGPEYKKHFGIDYDTKQRDFNMYDPLFCLCNPVYQWSRKDLLGNLQREAEDVTRMLRYKTSAEGEPLYVMGRYRVGTFKHHSLWFPINTGFYLWFNILENSRKSFSIPGKLTWLEFTLTELAGKQLHINCYLIDTTNNEALKKSRSDTLPDLEKDTVADSSVFKSRLFDDTEGVVYVDVTKAFHSPNTQATCLLWITCSGKAWLGNAWVITKRPKIVFKDLPDKQSTKKKLNL